MTRKHRLLLKQLQTVCVCGFALSGCDRHKPAHLDLTVPSTADVFGKESRFARSGWGEPVDGVRARVTRFFMKVTPTKDGDVRVAASVELENVTNIDLAIHLCRERRMVPNQSSFIEGPILEPVMWDARSGWHGMMSSRPIYSKPEKIALKAGSSIQLHVVCSVDTNTAQRALGGTHMRIKIGGLDAPELEPVLRLWTGTVHTADFTLQNR